MSESVSSCSACAQSVLALPGLPLRAKEISYARMRMRSDVDSVLTSVAAGVVLEVVDAAVTGWVECDLWG